GDFALQFVQFSEVTTAQALAGEAAQLAFRHVEPTAVFGSEAKCDTLHVSPSPLRLKDFVESAFRVRIEIVQHYRHFCTIGVTRVQQVRYFQGPVCFCALRAGRRLTEASEWFGKH